MLNYYNKYCLCRRLARLNFHLKEMRKFMGNIVAQNMSGSQRTVEETLGNIWDYILFILAEEH